MSARVVVGSVIGLGVVVAGCAPAAADSPAGAALISVYDVDDDRRVCNSGSDGFPGLATRDCALDVAADAAERFAIENSGDDVLHVTAAVDGDGFTTDDDEFAVDVGASIDIVVGFNGFEGDRGTLRLTSDAANDDVINVALGGHGELRPVPQTCFSHIDVEHLACDFGDVDVGAGGVCDLSINNSGQCELVIDAVEFAAGTPTPSVFGMFTRSTPTPMTVPAHSGVPIRLYGRPHGATTSTGTLVLSTNDPDAPDVRVPLRVNGVAP